MERLKEITFSHLMQTYTAFIELFVTIPSTVFKHCGGFHCIMTPIKYCQLATWVIPVPLMYSEKKP